jgi:hypothetical protein
MNAIAIHRLNGCSLHMLASFWDTLTLFVLNQKQQKNAESMNLNLVTNSYLKIKGPDTEEPTASAQPPVGHVTSLIILVMKQLIIIWKIPKLVIQR